MSPGFKYHVVSISAIFFALTIGLVIGSVFVSPSFANRQEHAISKLQQSVNTDIEEKRQELGHYKECVETISPLALDGKLRNAVVAIVQVGDYPEAATRASEAVELASPRAIVHYTLTSSLDRSPEELSKSLTAPHASDPSFPADGDALVRAIGTAIAHGDPVNAHTLSRIEREGFVRLTSDDNYAQPASMVVIVGGSRSVESARAGRVDVPLIKSLVGFGVSVVACEPRDAPASDIPAYRAARLDISTIDNVDTDIGRCALVLAFLSEHGDFGVKPGAGHILPPLQSVIR